MSSSAARIHRITLIPLVLAGFLTGCNLRIIGPPPGSSVGMAVGSKQILLFQEEITHGMRLGMPSVVKTITGAEVRLAKPVAVGGYGSDVYISDAVNRSIYRYNTIGRGFHELKDAGSLLVGESSQIHVAPDQTFFVVDPFGNQVLQFDRNGALKRDYKDFKNVPQPMAVVTDPTSGHVRIADGTHGYVVVFNRLGQPLFATGSRGSDKGQFLMITAMSQGVDGLYVVDRLRQDVQVLSTEGSYLYAFGKGNMVFPTAIVVDRANRVFVADSQDNTIKIFKNSQLIDTVGGSGNAPGQFHGVSSMWLSQDDLLYVADSLNGRVQVFRVLADSSTQK